MHVGIYMRGGARSSVESENVIGARFGRTMIPVYHRSV